MNYLTRNKDQPEYPSLSAYKSPKRCTGNGSSIFFPVEQKKRKMRQWLLQSFLASIYIL